MHREALSTHGMQAIAFFKKRKTCQPEADTPHSIARLNRCGCLVEQTISVSQGVVRGWIGIVAVGRIVVTTVAISEIRVASVVASAVTIGTRIVVVRLATWNRLSLDDLVVVDWC